MYAAAAAAMDRRARESVSGIPGEAVCCQEGKKKANKGARGMPVALGGEEGRDKLRKAAVRGKWQMPCDPRMSEWGNPSGAIPTPRRCRGANPGN